MAIVTWPPPTPPNNRANTTPQLDDHPADHNKIANALDTLVDRADMSTAWQAANINGNFVNFGAGQTPACFRVVGRTTRQWVQCSAMLKTNIALTGIQQVLFLPGYGPQYIHLGHATCSNVANGAPNGIGDVRIQPDGNLSWFGTIVGAAPAAGGWLAIEMWWPLGATV
jgi:hypothetical protein